MHHTGIRNAGKTSMHSNELVACPMSVGYHVPAI